MRPLKTKWIAGVIASITRKIPLLSGCGNLANGRWLPRPAREPGSGFLSLRNGKRILASLPDYIGNALFYFGDHDPKVTAVMKRFIKEGDTVLDIGANIGVSSLYASEFVGPSGKVYAFEPQPNLCEMLEKTFEENQSRNITLLPYALGEADQEITLHIPSDNLGGASIIEGFNRGSTREVQSRERVTSDAFRELNLGHVGLVKIDVEGYEVYVLRGACRYWENDPPEVIIFEYRDKKPLMESELVGLLQPLGYEFYFMISRAWRLELRPVGELKPGEKKSHDVVALMPPAAAGLLPGK